MGGLGGRDFRWLRVTSFGEGGCGGCGGGVCGISGVSDDGDVNGGNKIF